ncbi:MAG: hypothetical protein M1376_02755, partial [Planctomycetes bacterium]|nr:hypothetical protein [Planctomycetota bacterium]
MLGDETHHEGAAEFDAVAVAQSNHLFSLGNSHSQRLLTEHVLARLGARFDVVVVQMRRRRDIDGIDVLGQKLVQTRRRRGLELLRDLGVGLGIHIEDSGQGRVRRLCDTFRNRSSSGDAAGADHTPPNLLRHRTTST